MIKHKARFAGLFAAAVVVSALQSASCTSESPETAGPYCGTDVAYPPSAADTLPESMAFEGPQGRLTAQSLFSKCATSSTKLIVFRATASWCGTCLWHADNFEAEVPPDVRGQVQLIDVLVGDRSNDEPTLDDATAWASRAAGASRVVLDPQWQLSKAVADGVQLPAYVVVDPRSMKVLDVQGNPSPAALRNALARSASQLHGKQAPAPDEDRLFDGLFTKNEWDMIRAITLPTSGLPDPSNRYADDAVAAGLGRAFFHETSWSANGSVSCESCHRPEVGFADSVARSQGIGLTKRNAMTVLMAGYNRWFFADGRADSAWMQALGPLEEPDELGSSRLRVAHVVASKFADRYTRAFREGLPNLDGVPADGRPGDPAWDSLPDTKKDEINRLFANVGKAIAAYERTIIVSAAPFDRYNTGATQALSASEKQGLKEFFVHGCAQCHFGPTLSNDAFHVLRFPSTPEGADRGRASGTKSLAESPFARSGPYSDAPEAAYASVHRDRHEGAFKTPTLRAIASTAPYGHAGNIVTLEELVELYRQRGLPSADPRAAGTLEPWIPPFGPTEGTHIAAFLASFVGGAQWW